MHNVVKKCLGKRAKWTVLFTPFYRILAPVSHPAFRAAWLVPSVPQGNITEVTKSTEAAKSRNDFD